MARPFLPKIACSNELLSGVAVWFTEEGLWSSDIGDAVLAETPEQADILLKTADEQRDKITGVWLADAQRGEDGRSEPTHFREQFRVSGPTYTNSNPH